MKKENLRTNRITVWWRWWDEAEHKSSSTKRLAFYDALFRYAFRGDVPEDPIETGSTDGEAWAAYDATHHFDVIDNEIDPPRQRGGQPGNQNAAKRKNESENESKNESRNESENEESGSENESFINPKDIKNKSIKVKRHIAGSGDPSLSVSDAFEVFWREYPPCTRKYDKKKCLDKWKRMFSAAKDAQALFDSVMDGLAKWRRSEMWTKDAGQFIKSPHAWLNGECWASPPEDAPAPVDDAERSRMEMARMNEEFRRELREKGVL